MCCAGRLWNWLILICMAAFVLLLGSLALQAGDLPPAAERAEWRETDYSRWLAAEHNGTPEFRLPDASRIDIVTADVAWEVEWAAKWEQAFGQSAFYAAATGLKPGIWLLKRKDDDEDYQRCLATIWFYRAHGCPIEFRVLEIP